MDKTIDFVGYARKFLVATAGALAQAVLVLSDNNITTVEWITIALAALTAAGVYAAKNEPVVK